MTYIPAEHDLYKKATQLFATFITFFIISFNSYAVDTHSASLQSSFEHLEKLSEKDPKLALKAAQKLLSEQGNTLSSTDKVTLLAKLAQYSYFMNYNEQSQQYIEQAYVLKPDLSSDSGISLLITQATLLIINNKLEEAKALHLQAEKNAINTENNVRLAEIYSAMAEYYSYQHNDIQALQYFHKSYILLEKLGLELEMMYLKAQMAASYSNIYDDEKAIELANETLNYFLSRKFYFDAVFSQNGLALSYLKTKQYDKSIAAYHRMIEFSTLAGNKNSFTVAYLGLADAYLHAKQYQQSREYLQKFHESKTLPVTPYTEINYLFLEANLALESGDIALAQQFISEAEAILGALANSTVLSWKVKILSFKAKLFSLEKDYQSAYTFEKQARLLHLSYQNNQRETIRSKYKVLFDTDQAHLENKILERDHLLDKAALTTAKQEKRLQHLMTLFSLIFIVFLIFIVRKQLKESKTLNKLANTDTLTELANRRFVFAYGESKVNLAKKNHQPLAVIIFDVDYFKTVNDTYGHSAGDIALISIAKIANEYVREHDILGRIGGEEFLLVLPETSAVKASAVGQRIRRAIEENDFFIKDQHIRITASFGVAELSQQETFSQMFQRADAALYQAKAQGRNLVKMAEEQD